MDCHYAREIGTGGGEMSPNFEPDDGDFPDPDYGIWGDKDCLPFRHPIPKPDPERDRQIARERRKREQSAKVSRDFNSYMIELFNARQKP